MSSSKAIELLRIARTAIQNQDYVTAMDAMQQLVAHDQQHNNKDLELVHRSNLALMQNRLGFSEEALESLSHALMLAREQQSDASESGILGSMGGILREMGNYDAAREHLEKALRIAHAISDQRGAGKWLHQLALLHDDMGDAESAYPLHQQAVAISREMNDQRGLANRLGSMGGSLITGGNVLQGLACYEEAVQIDRQLGDHHALLTRLNILGSTYADLGRRARSRRRKEGYSVQALAYHREALYLTREQRNHITEAVILRSMAAVYADTGSYSESLQHYRDAMALFVSLHMPDQAAIVQQAIDTLKHQRDTE